jgi:hypothetical protein
MVTLVVREDLSQRTVLSKSALTTFDMCQQQAWWDIHDRRPLVPNERITFGSAVDAAVEQVATMLRDAGKVDMTQVMAAAQECVTRDETDVNLDEVEKAAERFVVEIAGKRDWKGSATQPNIVVDLPDLGPISTHPDIVYGDNRVDDVKTSKRSKVDEPTFELGFYAVAVEAFTDRPVPSVGYLTWVRVTRPYWQELSFPVTDELRRWTRERAGAYVRAKKADEVLNRKAEVAKNYSFPGGPAFSSLCEGCQYAPANGGECAIAYRGEAA